MGGSKGSVGSAWTVIGVAALFAGATYRLGARGLETIQNGLEPGQWAALAGLLVAFTYGEGIVALDRRWVPRLFERARRLRDERRLLVRILAPLYGLSLVGTSRGELVRGWLTTSAIVGAIWLVRSFPDPWRGIIDLSVAVALAWGVVAILRRMPRLWKGSDVGAPSGSEGSGSQRSDRARSTAP